MNEEKLEEGCFFCGNKVEETLQIKVCKQCKEKPKKYICPLCFEAFDDDLELYIHIRHNTDEFF
jgi:hypothetical protein